MGGEGRCWIQCETREPNEGIEAMWVERGSAGFNVRQGSTTGDRDDVGGEVEWWIQCETREHNEGIEAMRWRGVVMDSM